MPIRDLIKKLLRISTNALDDVIDVNIEACLNDMKNQDIDVDKEDAMIPKAIELYCKWQMNHNGEADRYERNYCALIYTMSQQEAHRVVNADEG